MSRYDEDLISVNSSSIRDKLTRVVSVDGAARLREENSAELARCTAEFLRAQNEYMERNRMKSRGEVNSSIPGS